MILGKHIVYDKNRTMDSSSSIGGIIYDDVNTLLKVIVSNNLYHLVDRDVRMGGKSDFNSLYFQLWAAIYYSIKNSINL